MDYFGMFISGIYLGKIKPSMKQEFHLLQFAKFCRQYDASISDLEARKLLKPYEILGKIRYTEMLYFKIIE
jgi:hypothetical protein